MTNDSNPSFLRILKLAWPIIIANAAVPLLGLVDTAVIGNVGNIVDLGAIALGALIFSFVYWSFGFLRMSTTGFVAQAVGAGKLVDVRAALGRAWLLALLLGVLLIALQLVIQWLAFLLLSGSGAVESAARAYFTVRIWGAPATLSNFVLMGLLIGMGKSRQLLLFQLFLNGMNMLLDIWFAGFLGLGATGIAIGTVVAEWLTAIIAGYVVVAQLRGSCGEREPFWPREAIFDREQILRMLSSNFDIMLRTLLLVFSFAFFTNQSARFGDDVLAANHILLQLISFAAFFLDGFAFVTEAEAGKALGGRNREAFVRAVKNATILAAITALVLGAGLLLVADSVVSALTDIAEVRVMAGGLSWLAAIYIICSFPAFQLDGIYIGVSYTRQMRQGAIYSLLVFLVACWVLLGEFGVIGLWWAMVIYVLARAAALLIYFPSLLKRFDDEVSAACGQIQG